MMKNNEAGTAMMKNNEAGTAMMKKCPFCAEEIQNDAIKCRFCREMLVKKRGSLLGLIVSTLIFIASLGYAVFTFFNEHASHGHYDPFDPAHVLGLIVVVVSAIATWRGLAQRRKNQ